MPPSTVSELTLDEFKRLVREIVVETLSEMLPDPDAGLELNEDIRRELLDSITAVRAGEKTIPAREVAAGLGLNW